MTIWYDMTTTLRATSRNGIANSEWSLGRELVAGRDDVRCFALGGAGGGHLVEIDPGRDLVRAVYSSDAGRATQSERRSWRALVKERLVTAFGPAAIPLIDSIARARAALIGLRQRARSAIATRSRPDGMAPAITSDDVVVTMGADWDGTLLAAIGRVKAQTGCRVVAMVYDLIPLTHTHLAFHKDRELFDRYYRRLLDVADLVTCISDATRTDLLAFAADRGLALPDCEVLRLGDADTDPEVRSPVTRESFYLWVGTLERRKNLELLYDALRIAESEGGDVPTVVVAGQRGWGTGDLLDEISLGSTIASRSLVLLGEVSDATLASLYQRTAALLFPSLYEGWGLPLREAAIRGCPVAAGDTSAAREALADYPAATFLSTTDPGPWAEYLTRTHAPGVPARTFTWNDSADQLLSIVAARASGLTGRPQQRSDS